MALNSRPIFGYILFCFAEQSLLVDRGSYNCAVITNPYHPKLDRCKVWIECDYSNEFTNPEVMSEGLITEDSHCLIFIASLIY